VEIRFDGDAVSCERGKCPVDQLVLPRPEGEPHQQRSAIIVRLGAESVNGKPENHTFRNVQFFKKTLNATGFPIIRVSQ
jgi:hypothetical protein